MPFLTGGSLKTRIPKKGVDLQSPERSKLLKWASQIGHAVAGMHQRGYVHVDIKPPNAMLDKDENAYLIDFGSAVRSGGGIGHSGMTPLYMPPEAWGDSFEPNSSSDTYSYAVTQCEMFYGEDINPLRHLTTQEIGQYSAQGEKAKSLFQRKLQELRSTLEKKKSDPVAQVLLGCLEQDPAKRLTMSQAVTEIDQIKAQNPPPPLPPRT